MRPLQVRKALDFFKATCHPAFTDIEISEENHEHLRAVVQNDIVLNTDDSSSEDNRDVLETSGSRMNDASSRTPTVQTERNVESQFRKTNTTRPEEQSAAQRLRDKGQNQILEDETAVACENVPVGAEPLLY